MTKRCTVCNHPARPEIDRGLLHGVSYHALAAAPRPLPFGPHILAAGESQNARFFTPLRSVQNDT
ncbi:MAG: hypothetical protein ACYDIC_08735 [Desulfobaccales bacterium]